MRSNISLDNPKASAAIQPSLANIQFLFPLRVLISPLCANMRIGCERFQLGNVFVEKR